MSGHKLEELELLDLKKVDSINDMIQGMSKCSFGARCIGEVTDKLYHIIAETDGKDTTIIFEGDKDSRLGKLLYGFASKHHIHISNAEHYNASIAHRSKFHRPKNMIVIGRFSETYEKMIHDGGSENTIFINKERLVTPGQTRDGYFPNVVFADPRFVMPFIDAALKERLTGKATTATAFINDLSSQHRYGGLADEVAAGATNFSRMINDPAYTIFMTMSGAMTIAQMSYVLCDMIDSGMIHSVTTTGAAMAHGLVESMGYKHYKHNPNVSDTVLAREKLNRVTDTLEPEANFDHIDHVIGAVLDSLPKGATLSPRMFHEKIGKYLHENFPNERGILKSAYEQKIPVFVPAFFDSEIGNDITTYNMLQAQRQEQGIHFDIEQDNLKLVEMIQNSRRTGLFTVGGGVPRNWTQNVAPLIEIINSRTNAGYKEKTFSSGVKIAPDPMDLGHLGGCTYSEGMSWRKMDPHGQFVEIHGDATMVWPLIVKYAIENRN